MRVVYNSGGLPILANEGSILGLVQAGNNAQFKDATATPKVSPLTISTVTEIKVPTDAIACTFSVLSDAAAAVKIGADSAFTNGYFTIAKGASLSIDCANENVSFFVAGVADAETQLHFIFTML